MKKGEGRSHSWWWDSHISPKNSKWLQENLSEMDSKVNAMLKIIEEDADSFAQRAEMYYRKRPELIALVEDFYRTYRALVERYTFLTKEIRQNIAPALQAQLGITPESAQNSPIKRGIDGFDIVSPSYSYTGASEFDYDSPSEVSAKGNTDDELSPLGFATFNDRPFGSKAKFAGDHARRGGLDSGGLDISQLQKDLRHLQDENKAFASKSFEDAAKLKSLELELSNLQVRLRSLEADDKATKRKFKSVQEQEQKLEAENLKLNHALILAKEEKSDLVQQCNKKVEIACSRNKQLEDEVAALRKENLEIHAQALERLEHIQKAEESIQKVQTALASMEEQSRKESLVLRETIEQQSQEFRQKLLAIEEENAKLRKQTEADANAMKELEDRLTKLITYRNDLEQLFLDSEKEKKICLEEKAAALAKIDELQRELDVVQTDKQSLSEQILQGGKEIETLKSIKCKLEDDIVRHEAVKLEGEKHITKLEEQIKEGNKIRDALTDQCRLCEERCKALEALEIQLRNELASVSAENAGLQEMKSTLEDGTEKANLHIKELQENVSSLASEKAVVVAELEKVREKLKSNDIKYCKLQQTLTEKEQKINKLDEDITTQLAHIKKLEDDLSTTLEEKASLEERENKVSQDLSDLQKEFCLLQNQLEEEHSHRARSLADHQGTVSKLQEDLSHHQQELKKLQHECLVKDEVIEKAKDQVDLLQEQLQKSKNDNKLLGNRNEEIVKQIADLESQIEYLKEKLSHSLAVNVSLADEVSEKGKMIELLNLELSSLRSQNIALTEDIALRTGHELGLQEQIKTLKEQIEFVHCDLQRSLEKRHTLESEIEKLQESSQKHAEAHKSLLDEQQKLFDELSLKKKNSDDLELKMKHLIREREQLVGEISTLKQSNEDLGIKTQKLTEERDQCLNEIRHMKKTSEDLESKINHAMKERSVFMTESASRLEDCTNLNNKIKTLENECQSLQAEKGSLEGMLERSEKEKKMLEKKLSDIERRLDEEMVNLQQAYHKVQETEGALVGEQQKHLNILSLMTKKTEQLEQNMVQLSEERDHLLKKVSECSKNVEDLQNDWQSAVKENQSLKETNDSLMTKLSDAEGRLVDETEKLRRACKIVEEKDAALRANLVQLSQERDQLLKDVSECSKKTDDLQNDWQSAMKENHSLKETNDSLMNKLSEAEGRLVDETEKLQQACKIVEEKDAALRANLKHLTDERTSLQKEVSVCLEECAAMKQKQMNLERDIELLQTENGSLKLVIASIEKEKDFFEKSNVDLTENFSEAKKGLEDLESRLSNALTENASLRDNVLLKENNITTLENKNLVLEKDVCFLQGQVSALKGREESLILDVSKRSEEIQTLNADIELLHNDIHERENKISKLESQYLDSQNKNEAFEKDVCSLQGQVSTMKGREESLLLDLTNRSVEIQTLNAEIELLHDGVRDKENIIANLEAELLASQNKNEALEKDACSMQGHVSALKVREESLLLDVSKRFEEIQMLNAEIELLRQAVNEKETKLSKLEAESLALQNNNQALEKDVLSLQGQVSTMKGREESILLDLTKRSEEIQTLNSEFKLLRDDVHHKENSIANLEAELLASQSKNEALDKDICNLQDQISAMKSSEGMLLLDLSKRSEEMQRLNAQTVLLQDDVHQKDCNIANLVAEILASQNKNQALDKDICILQDQVSSMKSQEELLLVELDKKSEEIQKLQTEIQLLRDRTSFMEKEIEELHEGIRCGHEEKSVLSRDIEMHSEISGALKLKIEKLEEEMQSKEKAAVLLENSLKEKLSKLESENTKLCDGIESQKVEIQKLTKAVTGLEEEKKSAVDRMELVIQEREMLDMKFSELHNKLDSANKKLHDSEDDLRNKVDDVKKLQEDVSKLEAAKLEAEKQLQFNSTVTKGYQEESEILKKMLADVQDECKKLEELYSQSMMDYEDAQKTILNCNQDLEKQRNDIEILKKEASSLDVVRIELEQALHHLNEEKVAQNTELEKIHEHLSCLQKEHDMSLHTIEALNLQLQEKEKSINELQEKLHVAEKHQVYMAEEQTRTNSDRDAKLKFLEKEIAHLKSENLQSSNKISAQHEDMIKLKDEYSTLQALRDSLQNERDISMKQVIEGQKDIQDMKAQIKEKEEENSKLALQIEELKQSLVHAEKEGANLSECLQQANDELDASKQIMKDEVSILHRDLSAKVSLISDMNAMVSSLENKRATLSEELTFKDETISDLQKKLSALEGDNKAMSMTSDSQAAEISSLKAALQELHDRLEKLATVADAREREVNQLHLQLDQVMEENKEAKEQIHCASEEVSQVKGEIKNLMIQVQSAQERYQKEHTKYNEAVAERDSFHEEFEKLKHTVAIHERAAEKVEEEMSSLYKIKNDMEVDVASMSRDLKESQVVSANLLKQIVSDLEDLIELLSSGQSVSVVGKSDNSLHIGEQLPSVTNGTNGKISGEEPQTSLISENFLDSLKDSDVAVKECGTEELSQEGLSLVIGDAIQRLKEKVLKLQEENRMLKITSENDHNDIEASLRELQIDFLRLEDERAHHNSEVSLYKSEINYLMHLLDGKCEHEESKAGHPEVRLLQDRLFDLRTKAVKMEEENMRLMKEMKTRKDEAGKSQEMLSDVESKCLRYAWQLKNNLVSCNGEVKFIAAELQNSSNKIDQVMMMQMERLTNWQKVNDGPSTIDLEKSASFNGIKKVSTSVIPLQLQDRLNESMWLLEALGVLKMMLTETLKKSIFRATDEAESLTVVDKQDPISSEERLSYSVTNYAESRYADIVSVEDSMKSVRKEGSEMQCEEPEEISLVQEHSEQSSPAEGENENNEECRLSQARANLGRRLYQAQMDEKLENELLELKEERRKLEEELRARVEQVEKMERELGNLQAQIKEGNEQQQSMDQRRQHLWLQKRRKVEIRASKIVDELVSQREQIRNLQDVVISWTKQQEVETGKLEKQVSVIVSHESNPTMDGWDDEQVNHLLKEMQTRKAWTRRHSLELKSVEKELRRVSSTIELTQKELMVREGGQAELNEEDESDDQEAEPQAGSLNTLSRTSSLSRRHRSRFRLHRFLLFIMPGKKGCLKGCFKRTRSSSHLSPRHSKPAASSSLAVTGKKLKCLTCVPCLKKPMTSEEH